MIDDREAVWDVVQDYGKPERPLGCLIRTFGGRQFWAFWHCRSESVRSGLSLWHFTDIFFRAIRLLAD